MERQINLHFGVRKTSGARAEEFPADLALEAPADADSLQRAEEESMLAEAGQDDASTPRRDPEEAALELLQNELGARRIDNG